MEQIIKLASEIYMIALCLMAGPSEQKEVRIDLVGTRGLMDTLVAERTDQGFAIYDERGRERLPFLTLERRADKKGGFIAKGPNSQKEVIDLSAEKERLEGLQQRTKLLFKTETGSQIQVARSGAVTYLTEDRSDRTYVVHAGDPSPARREHLASEALETKIFKLRYADPARLSSMIKPILGVKGEIAADERTRSLILTTSQEMLHMIERLVEELDVETVDRADSHRP